MEGKRWARKSADRWRGVEEDWKSLLESHLAGDTAGYYVARSELGGGVDLWHEAVAVDVEEDGAFAADGLGDEERQ